MGNRLSQSGGGGGGGLGMAFDGGAAQAPYPDSAADSDESAPHAVAAADCVSTLSLVSDDQEAPEVGGGGGGGLSNLGFAPSLKAVNATAAPSDEDDGYEVGEVPPLPPTLAPPQPRSSSVSSSVTVASASPPSSRPRICPILQNGRQVTKDFYWVLPERRGRLSRQRSLQEASLPAAAAAVAAAARRSDDEDDDDDYKDVYQNLPATTPRRACRSESGWAGGGSPSSARQLTARVRREVPGVTDDECRLALGLHGWDAGRAARYLMVEQLFRLGLADRPACLGELEATDWRLEAAGARLVDRAAGWGE